MPKADPTPITPVLPPHVAQVTSRDHPDHVLIWACRRFAEEDAKCQSFCNAEDHTNAECDAMHASCRAAMDVLLPTCCDHIATTPEGHAARAHALSVRVQDTGGTTGDAYAAPLLAALMRDLGRPFTAPKVLVVPSVLDVAIQARQATVAAEKHDRLARSMKGDARAVRKHEQALAVWSARADVLDDMVTLGRAESLGDAAAQLVHAERLADYIECFDPKDDVVAEHMPALRRVLASVIPVIAAAAGVDLATIADEGLAERMEERWSAEEVQA